MSSADGVTVKDEQIGTKPTAAEALANVRETLEEYRRVAEQLRSDPGTWSAGEGLLNLALLERRMGAMERALDALGRCDVPMSDGVSIGGSMAAHARSALADAPPVFTLEEVETLVRTLFEGTSTPAGRPSLLVRDRLSALRPAGGPLVPTEGRCAYPIGGSVVCLLPPGHDGEHGVVWASTAELLIYERGGFVPGHASASQAESSGKSAAERTSRDAALEEAAANFNGLCIDCQLGPVNPDHERCWHEHDSATRIRALTSQPARRYVDADGLWNAMVTANLDPEQRIIMLETLGVDLDAVPQLKGKS